MQTYKTTSSMSRASASDHNSEARGGYALVSETYNSDDNTWYYVYVYEVLRGVR